MQLPLGTRCHCLELRLLLDLTWSFGNQRLQDNFRLQNLQGVQGGHMPKNVQECIKLRKIFNNMAKPQHLCTVHGNHGICKCGIVHLR